MGTMKGRTEGGSGGRRGHSNMDHWVHSEEHKDAGRIRRRLEAKKAERGAIAGKSPGNKHGA